MVSRRERLKATASQRLGVEDAQRIRLLLGQIRDSWAEVEGIFPAWAQGTTVMLGTIPQTKGLCDRLKHDMEYGDIEGFVRIVERLGEEGSWK